MVRLEKVNGKNVWDILKLKVADNQRHFVSANERSIIEAYIAIAGNGQTGFGIHKNISLWESGILLAVIRAGE